MSRTRTFWAVIAVALWTPTPEREGRADVHLPSIFGDHMVLQRGKPVVVWGVAGNGERVTVELAGRTAETRADPLGTWHVTLPPPPPSEESLTLVVRGKNTITIRDILAGEVWIGSGQSNMEWNVRAAMNAAEEIARARWPKIRLFLVPKVLSGLPQRNVRAQWKVCSPETIPNFSAVLYFFGRHIHRELGVPVGLIASSWGGSRIEPWTPPPGFAGVKALSDFTQRIRSVQLEYLQGLARAIQAADPPRPDLAAWLERAMDAAKRDEVLPAAPPFEYPPHPLAGWADPASMYNAMIHPLVPFAVRGAIWYQGESNLNDGTLYAYKMRALIEGWRDVRRDASLSFYWAALAPFDYGGDPYRLPRIWEAQRMAMALPRTGMAVITDIGNLRDIHPRNKQEVGRRLALWALAKDYGRDIVYSGPLYRGMRNEGQKIRVFFDHTGSGLASRDGKPLSFFEIAGEDLAFVPAKAEIDGDTVLVWSEKVKAPKAVRFAWHQRAEPNLINKEGLPAAPFRTTSTPPEIRGRTLFVKETVVEIRSLEPEGIIRYTLNGPPPGPDAPIYQAPLRITGTATVRARFFRPSGEASPIAERTFRRVEPRKYRGKILVPGVRYSYYEGQWNKLPDFAALEPVKEGILDGIDLGARRRNDGFGFVFRGYLEVSKAGRYTFRLGSDDGSRLVIDGRILIDNDGVHPFVAKEGTAELAPGLHEIEIAFFEAGGQEGLAVSWRGPDSEGGPLPLWCEE